MAEKKKAARLIHIDGARGYLLLMMFLAHFSFTHWTPLYYLHHGNYTPVFDGEFFVLLSGFVCALSYQGAYAKGGAWTCEKAVLRRLRWVYLYQVGVSMAMVVFSVWALPIKIMQSSMATLQTPMLVQLLSTLTFVRMPQYLDILILYMSLMLFIPLALFLLSQKRMRLYWFILIAAWLVARFHVDIAVAKTFAEQAFDPERYFRSRGSFNPFSYALVFYTGFYFGYRYKVDGAQAFLHSALPLRKWCFAGAALVVIAFAISELFRTIIGTPLWVYDPLRYEITITGLVGLAAITYFLYFLLAAEDLPASLNWLAKLVGMVFTLPLFVLIGQNSLFFYSMHVLGVFGSTYVIQVLGMTESSPFILLVFMVAVSIMIALTAAKKRFLPSLP